MNILIVNYEYPPLGGGGGVATKDLAQQLAKRHTVHVITSAFRDLPKNETFEGVHIHRVPVFGRVRLPTATIVSMLTFVPSAFLKGVFLCRSVQFDVVNGQFVLPSGVPAAWLARFCHVPFVLSLIGGDLYDPSKGVSPHRHGILRALIRSIARQARGITAISHDTKKRAQQLHGITQPITVIPIGLVPRSVPDANREQLRIAEGLAAVSIGRLIPRKGYDTLIRAWELVPSGSLYIIGAGPLREKLTKLIKSLGLAKRVHLLGAVPETEKQQLLRAVDVYVSAASHEGFGIVFLEAMDAALPIVAPNEGGQTDFLEHEHEALLVDSSRPEAIARAVQRIADDETFRRCMSERNREAVKNFYIEHTTEQFEEVLKQATATYEHSN